MKKEYEAPSLEFETYELDASIASNCAIVVKMGPEAPDAMEVCDDYYEETGEDKPAARSIPHNVQFWSEKTCDCYYSAGGKGCFTS